MAENAGIILKRLSSKPTFQHFSICQQFLPVSAIFSFQLIIGKRVKVT
jgi:hypothetical protein